MKKIAHHQTKKYLYPITVIAFIFPFSKVGAQKDAVCEGAGAVQSGSNCDIAGVTVTVTDVLEFAINTLSWVAGAIAVIMVIIAGLKYITSGGDSNKVASAKKTLTYALVGIVVAILSQLMVQFVVESL